MSLLEFLHTFLADQDTTTSKELDKFLKDQKAEETNKNVLSEEVKAKLKETGSLTDEEILTVIASGPTPAIKVKLQENGYEDEDFFRIAFWRVLITQEQEKLLRKAGVNFKDMANIATNGLSKIEIIEKLKNKGFPDAEIEKLKLPKGLSDEEIINKGATQSQYHNVKKLCLRLQYAQKECELPLYFINSLQTYAKLLQFTPAQCQELTEKCFYTTTDVHLDRNGLIKCFTDTNKANQLIQKVHQITDSMTQAIKFLNLSTITTERYDKLKDKLFELPCIDKITQYLGINHQKKWVSDVYKNDYTTASTITVKDFLHITKVDDKINFKFDKTRFEHDYYYQFFGELYEQMLKNSTQSWLSDEVLGYIDNLDKLSQEILGDLHILTKGQFMRIDSQALFSRNSKDAQFIEDIQNDLKNNLSRDIATNDRTKWGKIFDCMMSQNFVDTKSYNSLIADLSILCATDKAKTYLVLKGSDGSSISKEATGYRDNGQLDYRLVYKYKETTQPDGTIKKDPVDISPREFFNELADLICIRSLGQINKQSYISVDQVTLDRKIKNYLGSSKAKAVFLLIQSLRYRKNFQEELKNRGIELIANDGDSGKTERKEFEAWLKKPEVFLVFPNFKSKGHNQKIFELLLSLNAVSINKDVVGSTEIIDEILCTGMASDPLTEAALIKHSKEEDDKAGLKKSFKERMDEYIRKVQDAIDEEFKGKPISAEIEEIYTNLSGLSNAMSTLIGLQGYLLATRYLAKVYSNMHTQDVFGMMRSGLKIALGTICLSLAVGFALYTLFSKGEWDWKKITLVILTAFSVIAMFLQIISMISKNDWLFKQSSKLNAAATIAVSLTIMLLSVFSIIEGVQLLKEGLIGKGILQISIASLQIVAAGLQMLALIYESLGKYAILLSIVGQLLQLIDDLLPNDVTVTLQQFQQKYPKLQVWKDGDNLLIYPDYLFNDVDEEAKAQQAKVNGFIFTIVDLQSTNKKFYKVVAKTTMTDDQQVIFDAQGEDFQQRIQEWLPKMLKFKTSEQFTDQIKKLHFNWRLFNAGTYTIQCLSMDVPDESKIEGGTEIEHKHESSDERNQTLTPVNFAWKSQSMIYGKNFSYQTFNNGKVDFTLLTLE